MTERDSLDILFVPIYIFSAAFQTPTQPTSANLGWGGRWVCLTQGNYRDARPSKFAKG